MQKIEEIKLKISVIVDLLLPNCEERAPASLSKAFVLVHLFDHKLLSSKCYVGLKKEHLPP